MEGHFLLRSGLHSRQFFQCALALQQMPVVEQFGAELANKVRGLRPATVISPAMGGLVLGQEVARQLGHKPKLPSSADSERRGVPGLKFFATDSAKKFRKMGTRFLGLPVEDVVHVDLKE